MQYISFALIFCIRCEGNVVWGTCAGMILLSNSIVGEKLGGQIKVCKVLLSDVINVSYHFKITLSWLLRLNFQIGGVGVTTQRNYFGRQIQSFESHIELKDPQLAMVSVVFNSVIYFGIKSFLFRIDNNSCCHRNIHFNRHVMPWMELLQRQTRLTKLTDLMESSFVLPVSYQ